MKWLLLEARRALLLKCTKHSQTRSLCLEKILTGALKSLPATIVSADGVSIENEDYEVFFAQDSALASWLLSTISVPFLPQFVGVETAAEFWSTVLPYVSKVKETCNIVASSGSSISDCEKIGTILNGISIEYYPFIPVITASCEPFTLDSAISVLFDAEIQLSSFNPLSNMSSTLNVVQTSIANLDATKE
ncbi:hypothetical protein GQ457_05G028590 [Hibiscus cannabinus]